MPVLQSRKTHHWPEVQSTPHESQQGPQVPPVPHRLTRPGVVPLPRSWRLALLLARNSAFSSIQSASLTTPLFAVGDVSNPVTTSVGASYGDVHALPAGNPPCRLPAGQQDQEPRLRSALCRRRRSLQSAVCPRASCSPFSAAIKPPLKSSSSPALISRTTSRGNPR